MVKYQLSDEMKRKFVELIEEALESMPEEEKEKTLEWFRKDTQRQKDLRKAEKLPNNNEDLINERQITSTPEEFRKALDRAAKIVDSWPEWKKRY